MRCAIPRFIYRTWRDDNLPISFQKAWNMTALYNPSFQQKLFTDDDMERFMYRHYAYEPTWKGAVYRAFNSINPLYGTARVSVSSASHMA